MKLREIVRFELAYQARGVSTWLSFAVLTVIAFIFTREIFRSDARNGEFLLNSPYAIAVITVYGSLLWLLVAAAVAGEAAARDVQTRMHSLTYTAPVRKAEYLGGRFLAAFALNALILLALPAGMLLGALSPGVEAELLGAFRPDAYFSAYGSIALPNAFVATAIQCSLVALGRRAVGSYVASVLLFVMAYIVAGVVAGPVGLRDLGRLLDPIGVVAVLRGPLEGWTAVEKNTRLPGLDGGLLTNRLVWLGVALGALAFTHSRFRFAHPTVSTGWGGITMRRRRDAHPPPHTAVGIRGVGGVGGVAGSTSLSIPYVGRTFGLGTHVRQTVAIAGASFGKIATSRGGLILLAVTAALAAMAVIGEMETQGARLLPRTDYVLAALTTPQAQLGHWITIPLLIIYCAGELVWRERDVGLSEITDATPVPEWVFFLGTFLGLGFVLVVCMAVLTAVGVLVQVSGGYLDLEIGRYVQILFGIQLVEYLLLAVLALVAHVVVNQKHVGQLAALVAFASIPGSAALGIEHNLLVYGMAPPWSYTPMRGFGGSLGPWLWLKLYWAAWALLLAMVARLLWARGTEPGVRARLQLARRRITSGTMGVAAVAAGLLLTVGGFIFYNTNMLNVYSSTADRMGRQAEYERRYARYAGAPQPRLTGTELHVEIHPERRVVEIRGVHRLVNGGEAAMETIHVATDPDVETRTVAFDRPAALALADEELGHRMYALDTPLAPGETLRLAFEVRYAPRGFRNEGVDTSVVANGTAFNNERWLPAIGYQASRELRLADARRRQGLAPRPLFPSHYDVGARQESSGREWIDFEAVVVTSEDQMAVAPGALRRTWTEGGRRYFHFTTDAPIDLESGFTFLSARYAVREERWNDVAIRIFHHPEHTANLDRMLHSVRAALDYYTEQFGPYPYGHISLAQYPGYGGMHAEASLITFQEGFSLFTPDDGSGSPDIPFAVTAHEVAHQWWGTQLAPARVEGVVVLSESLAEYSAYRVVERVYGREHVHRLILSQLRGEEETPRARAGGPLLRATDRFLAYGKGAVAMYALSEYVGEERVNGALRRLLEAHRPDGAPLATTLDLYRELQAVTPDSLQYLLHDLFAVNTSWELETERVTAEQTDAGGWRVTLEVRARKEAIDEAGVETEGMMDDWVQVGVFAAGEEGEGLGEPLYVELHRVRSGGQTITLTVPRKPANAGIDPYHLLMDPEPEDNIATVKIEG